MYKGDGSFKTKEIERQKSLIELLEAENEFVIKYNNIAIDIDSAKKNSLNMTELYKALDKISNELSETRNEISNYMSLYFNTKTDLRDILYSDQNHVDVRFDKKPIGYDKDRNPVYKDW